MQAPEIIPAGREVLIPITIDAKESPMDLEKAHFELNMLCNVPILTFYFGRLGQTLHVPISFKGIRNWPNSPQLSIKLICGGPDKQEAYKTLLLSLLDTQEIKDARGLQKGMGVQQIDAIIKLVKAKCMFGSSNRFVNAAA